MRPGITIRSFASITLSIFLTIFLQSPISLITPFSQKIETSLSSFSFLSIVATKEAFLISKVLIN